MKKEDNICLLGKIFFLKIFEHPGPSGSKYPELKVCLTQGGKKLMKKALLAHLPCAFDNF